MPVDPPAVRLSLPASVAPAAAEGGETTRPTREETRFRRLLGEAEWQCLAPAIRRRFTQHVGPGSLRLFRGEVTGTKLSFVGWIVARLASLAGSALPDQDGATGPASVQVTHCPVRDGQIYSRTYCRPGRLPQTINSVKCFTGPTGLEEHVGAGLVMRLTIHAEPDALVFRSAGYDLMVGPLRLPLPRWLSPGNCTITHRNLGDDSFTFTLELRHPRLGLLAHQVACFEEVQS